MTRRIWSGALALLLGLAACGDGGGSDSSEVQPTCTHGATLCGASCVDLLHDVRHCGACGNACDEGQACIDGTCQVACPEGQEVCDGECATLADSALHCGACGNACASGEVCIDGACQVSCADGQVPCDGGCFTLETSRQHCGACGIACGPSEVCADGVCRMGCPTGQSECGGGCWDLQRSDLHCGGCGVACGAGETCVAGRCEPSCPEGHALCDGVCADVGNDRENCGACGSSCADDEICRAGACELACPEGTTECGGACKDTRIDRNNCGGCGAVCGEGESCVDGSCARVCGGFASTLCDGACTNTDVDPRNCGGCGIACAAGEVCSGGACGTTCAPGADVCDGSCTSIAHDPANCGGCGTVCPGDQNATAVCASFVCGLACAPGWADCDGDLGTPLGNGCEAQLLADPTNCGACGQTCPSYPHGTTACIAGSCGIGQCDPGYTDCNGDPADGCEAVTDSDAANCGSCGNVCNPDEGCSAGVCVPAYGDTCSNAIALAVGINDIDWQATGREYIDAVPACSASTSYLPDGPDLVMSYTPTTSGLVTITITKPSNTRWHLLVEDEPCGTVDPANAMVCASDFAATAWETSFLGTAGQTYYLYLVDSTSGTLPLSDPLQLVVTEGSNLPPDGGLGDSCLMPAPIVAGQNTIAWSAVNNDYFTAAPSCNTTYAPTGPDVVLQYSATFDGKVDVSIAKPASQRWHLVASSGACGSFQPQLACASEFTATSFGVSFPVQTGNDYFLYVVDTTSGSAPLDNPLLVDVTERSCATTPAPAVLQLEPADGSTAGSVRPPFVVTFDQAVQPVGTITFTGSLGSNRTITLPSPDVTFSADGTTVTIRTAPFLSGEAVTVGWTGLPSVDCNMPAQTATWSVTMPVVPCVPGTNGLLGTSMTRVPLGALGTFTEYFVAADQDPDGWVYVGGTSYLFRARKNGTWSFQDVEADAGLTTSHLGYTMVIDGPNIYTVDDTTSTTASTPRVYRISSDGGQTWNVENAATFPQAPNDDLLSATAYGGRIYLLTEEFSAGTELWSFDPSGGLPATASLDLTFGGADYQYCLGLALDAASVYTTCRLQRDTSAYAVIRVDRATGTVTELTTAFPGNITAAAVHAHDDDGDGLADYLYLGSQNEAAYFVCQPNGPAPWYDVLLEFGTGTGNYGLAFDPASNALWAFDDDTLEFVKIQ